MVFDASKRASNSDLVVGRDIRIDRGRRLLLAEATMIEMLVMFIVFCSFRLVDPWT